MPGGVKERLQIGNLLFDLLKRGALALQLRKRRILDIKLALQRFKLLVGCGHLRASRVLRGL